MKRRLVIGVIVVIIVILIGFYLIPNGYQKEPECDVGYNLVSERCILENPPTGISDEVYGKINRLPAVSNEELSEYFQVTNENELYDPNWIFQPEKYSNYQCKNSNKNPEYINLIYTVPDCPEGYEGCGPGYTNLIMCDDFYFISVSSLSFGSDIRGPIYTSKE
jgi:hypothetical protein